uniref:Uncharacterized protein n=1 Tax=Rhizophora mucronata TaxID=61149 RepID=A0A2P2NFA3_RHIMU
MTDWHPHCASSW